MEKLKVTVEFQNALCDKLYNAVQEAEFDWLKENATDIPKKWACLIGSVDLAIYKVIREFFDNSGESNISFNLEKRVKAIEDYNERQRQAQTARLKAEIEMLEAKINSITMPIL